MALLRILERAVLPHFPASLTLARLSCVADGFLLTSDGDGGLSCVVGGFLLTRSLYVFLSRKTQPGTDPFSFPTPPQELFFRGVRRQTLSAAEHDILRRIIPTFSQTVAEKAGRIPNYCDCGTFRVVVFLRCQF